MSARDEATREAARVYHDSLGAPCLRPPIDGCCPVCFAFMNGWRNPDGSIPIGDVNAHGFAYLAGRRAARAHMRAQAKESADAHD